MTERKAYMFDTTAFNCLVNKRIPVESLAKCGASLFATHVQEDEIKRTPNFDKRDKLLKVFEFIELRLGKVRTTGGFYGVSKYGQATYADDSMLRDFRSDMDKCEAKRKRKRKDNRQDTLIGLTAFSKGFTLVTDDCCLREVTRDRGGKAISFEDFYLRFIKTATPLSERETA